MIIIRILFPIFYFTITTSAYSVLFKKGLIKSLAPSFFLQILVIMGTAMAFNSFSSGIALCAMISVSVLVVTVIKNKSVKGLIATNELVAFLLVYLLIFITNYGKHYTDWDEFSHWGLFVKETFRLDALFYKSPYGFVHKDYVPAITVFETLYCKLSLRFNEADSYRGIQLLQMSMALPIAFSGITRSDESIDKFLAIGSKLLIIIGLPLFLSSPMYYHTIYQDLIFGILIFYSMWIVFTEENGKYKTFILALALSMLVLSKMAAMAFLPMIVIFYLVYGLLFEKDNVANKVISSIIALVVPVFSWIGCNKYIDLYVANSGGGQSYDGISIDTVIGIITHNGAVSYQNIVEKRYFSAIVNEGIIGNASYLVVILILVIVLGAFAYALDGIERRKVLLIDLWIMLAGIAYALLMWILYLTSFSEYEAMNLASFNRYMETYLLAALFIAVGAFAYFSKEKMQTWIVVLAVIVLQNVIFFVDFKQLLPGTITGEKVAYEGETNLLLRETKEDDSICIVMGGDDLTGPVAMEYRCFPRQFGSIRPGKPNSDKDVWSEDLSASELVERLEQYDYVYFWNIDEYFTNEYKDAFVNPENAEIGKLCKVSKEGFKIKLQWVEEP